MARKRTRSKRKTRVRRVAARYNKFKSRSRMAYGRFRKRFRSFRPRFSFRRRRSFRRSGGGFSRRMPLLGIRVPGIMIWLAIIGGGWYFFKDHLKPLIQKMANKA